MDAINYDELLKIQTGGQGAQIHTDWEAKLMMKEAVKQAIRITLKEASEKATILWVERGKVMPLQTDVGTMGYKQDYTATFSKESILSLETEIIKNLTT